MNANYLKKLYEKSKKRLENKLEEKFSFSEFDIVNMHLFHQALSNNFNLWIHINKRDMDIFFRPVIFESLIKFFKTNCTNINKKFPEIGEKYQKRSKRYEVVGESHMEKNKFVRLKCTNSNQRYPIIVSEALDDFYTNYIKLHDESGNSNRETFKQMIGFVNQAIGIKYSSFSSFNNKFAIVCSKQHFENSFTLKERKAFPYEYVTKNEETQSNLPLEDFMFYIAPDYETIKNSVIDNDIDLDLVIFFGNQEDLQIQQDINRGPIKQVIFIGNQKPDVNNLLKWSWTLPEFRYFDETIKDTIVNTVIVNNEEFNKATLTFLNCIKDIEYKYGINLGSIYPYISYLYPIVIPSEDSRLANRLEDIGYQFQKKINQILIQEFSVIGVDHKKTYIELSSIYCDALFQINFANNVKNIGLRDLKETEYLLIPSGQTLEVWNNEIRKVNWQKVKVISLSGFRVLKKQSSVTILALENKELFDEVYGGIHNIQWLLYDDEQEKYKKFKTKYKNELIAEFKSKDRKILSGIDYPEKLKIETTESLIDRIFDKNISDMGKEYELSYHDHIYKEIIFFDNTSITLSANSSVILINENNKAIDNRVGDLRIGDKVRVYENQHKDVLLRSIVQSDKHGRFQKILTDSERWKKILKGYCSNDIKLNALASICGVETSTVTGWLKSDSSTKFPHNINRLRDLMNKETYLQIYKSSKNYKSITIAVGRDLSDEISNYIIRDEKGPLLSTLDNDTIETISQQNMPIRKIKSIKIVEIEVN